MATIYIDDHTEKKTKHNDIKCCICGHYINKIHYGGFVRGSYTDFINKCTGECTITMCGECLSKIMYYLEND